MSIHALVAEIWPDKVVRCCRDGDFLWSPYVIGQTIYIFILFLLLLLLSFFSSPNLSSRRLDVYHTSAHGVVLVMVALCNRETIYIFMLWFVLLFLLLLLPSSSFFSSPNLSGRRLDVYHTLAHGVALVRI